MKRLVAAGRRKRFIAVLIPVLSGILAGCGGSHGGSGPSTPVDDIPPVIIEILPASDSNGNPINGGAAAVFSEPLDPASVNTGSVYMRSNVLVSGTVRYNEFLPSVSFMPSVELSPGTDYIMTISQEVKDLAGNPLDPGFAWIFTTGEESDLVSPSVTLSNPSPGAVEVSMNSAVSTTFSEPMDPSTINAASFRIEDAAEQPVEGTRGYEGLTAVFTPMAVLGINRTYTVTLTTEATDLSGNPLASNQIWSFTTGTGADVIAPVVVSTDPNEGFVGFAVDGEVSAVFSEPMDPATLNDETFIVSRGIPAAGKVRYNAATQSATWSPTTELILDTAYTATLTTGVKDLSGNRLTESKSWGFRTGPKVSVVSGAFSLCSSAFSPNTITIPVGTTLTWKNEDSLPHTVTSSDGLGCTPQNALDAADRELNLGLDPGGTASYRFDAPGTYPYVCVIPGHQMRGTVIVE